MLKRSPFILLFVAFAAAGSAAGQVTIVLQIDEVPGSSTLRGYEGAIELSGLSWGASNNVSSSPGGGGQAGRAQFKEITFTKPVDKASPLLLQALTTGRFLPTASIKYLLIGGDGSREFSTIRLEDVVIVDQQIGSSEESPAELVSLRFRRIQWDVCSFDATGVQAGCNTVSWDTSRNSP